MGLPFNESQTKFMMQTQPEKFNAPPPKYDLPGQQTLTE